MKKRNKKSNNKVFNFRLLPLVVFCAVLMLSVRINDILGKVKDGQYVKNNQISVSNTKAKAQNKGGFDQYNQEISPSDMLLQSQNVKQEKQKNIKQEEKVDSSNFTLSELDVLQNLAKRRDDIEKRENQIDQKLALLRAAETQINNKIEQLKHFENNIKKLMGQYNEKQNKKLDSLVSLYTSMKPKDAARIFNQLEMPVLISLFEKMKPRKASAILAEMDSRRAKALTQELATRKEGFIDN